MENETTKTTEAKSQDEMIAEIYKFTRQTKNYMKWQLIITVALVVIPFIGALVIIPMVMSNLTSIYGGGALTQ